MSGSRVIFIAAAVLAAAIIAGCASPSPASQPTAQPSTGPNGEPIDRVVKNGDNVSVDYILTLSNGQVYDTSMASVAQAAGIYNPASNYEPLTFQIGSSSVIDGFNDAVIGMTVGETKNVTVPPEKGYGAYNASLVRPYPMSQFRASNITPYVNETLNMNNGLYILSAQVKSIDVANDTVYMDFNRPLAGQTLQFSITLRQIN